MSSMGNDSTKFVREASMAMRASRAVSGGMGDKLPALSAVKRMIFFCIRQTMPQTLSIMNQPIPPPMPMASKRLQSHLDDKGQSPKTEKCSDGPATFRMGVMRVGGDDHHPVPDARENRDHGRP